MGKELLAVTAGLGAGALLQRRDAALVAVGDPFHEISQVAQRREFVPNLAKETAVLLELLAVLLESLAVVALNFGNGPNQRVMMLMQHAQPAYSVGYRINALLDSLEPVALSHRDDDGAIVPARKSMRG